MAWNPANRIIEQFGGAMQVAAITQTSFTAPYRWQSGLEKGGTGGRIPSKHIPKLLAEAERLGIQLTADDFFSEPSEAHREAA